MGWALRSGLDAAPAALVAARGQDLSAWARRARIGRATRQLPCRATAALLRHPLVLSRLLVLLSVSPRLAAPLLRRICAS